MQSNLFPLSGLPRCCIARAPAHSAQSILATAVSASRRRKICPHRADCVTLSSRYNRTVF
jgi:hypothetical protein